MRRKEFITFGKRGTQVIQEKVVSGWLCHLDTQYMEPDGIHPRQGKGAGGRAHQAAPRDLSSVLGETGEVSEDQRLASVVPITRSVRELQAYQPDVSARKGYWTDRITQHIEQIQETRPSQQAFVEGRSCLSNRIFLNEYP